MDSAHALGCFSPYLLHALLNCPRPWSGQAHPMSIPNALALAGIALYQRWLSPHKGFHCAHAALHGGASCSAAVVQIIQQEGLSLPAIAARFAACRQAYAHLQVTGGPRVRGVCCCGPLPIPFRCG